MPVIRIAGCDRRGRIGLESSRRWLPKHQSEHGLPGALAARAEALSRRGVAGSASRLVAHELRHGLVAFGLEASAAGAQELIDALGGTARNLEHVRLTRRRKLLEPERTGEHAPRSRARRPAARSARTSQRSLTSTATVTATCSRVFRAAPRTLARRSSFLPRAAARSGSSPRRNAATALAPRLRLRPISTAMGAQISRSARHSPPIRRATG
jgi:hypothetical protein